MKKREKSPVVSDGGKKKINLKWLIMLIVNTIILLGVYFVSMNLPSMLYFLIAYLVIFTVLVLAYFIYNRAFTRKNLTVEMLPESWSEEVKREYIEDGKRRVEKSKWMLTIIIPFLITFGVDMINLFVLPYFERLF